MATTDRRDTLELDAMVARQAHAARLAETSPIERFCDDFVTGAICEAADRSGAARGIVADLRKYADRLEKRLMK